MARKKRQRPQKRESWQDLLVSVRTSAERFVAACERLNHLETIDEASPSIELWDDLRELKDTAWSFNATLTRARRNSVAAAKLVAIAQSNPSIALSKIEDIDIPGWRRHPDVENSNWVVPKVGNTVSSSAAATRAMLVGLETHIRSGRPGRQVIIGSKVRHDPRTRATHRDRGPNRYN